MTNRSATVVVAAVLVLCAVVVFGANAGGGEPIELQPAYRLMDGDEQVGLVFWLDYGNVIVTDSGTVYTCGCEVDCGYEVLPSDTPVPTEETPEPRDTPTNEPTLPPPPPTEEPQPTQMAKANCGLGNREEGVDPNENACGKKTGEENEPSGPPGKKKDK